MNFKIAQTETINKAKTIMSMLNAVKYGSMIAGGYLRDEVMSKPQKDLDILVKVDQCHEWSRVFRVLNELGKIMDFSVVDKDTYSGYKAKEYYVRDNTLVRVLGIKFADESIKEMDIIIISVPFIRYIKSRFPTNASQIYSFDGNYAFWGSGFERFRQEGVMQYTGSNYQEGYRTRMRAKYPECREEFPEGFKVTN